MKKEIRTAVYDAELRIEAYRFEGIAQPFQNHFHAYYVIGFMEDGERVLSCKNLKYTIRNRKESRRTVIWKIFVSAKQGSCWSRECRLLRRRCGPAFLTRAILPTVSADLLD